MNNINYINKDFNSIKSKLINFAKNYYPNTYNDFSEASPGMMFIDMVSYVGDILSLYQDSQIQENFIQFAKQRKNILAQSYIHGYKPSMTSVSRAEIDVFQIIPSKSDINGNKIPDYDYCIKIDYGVQLQSSSNPEIKFYVEEDIFFDESDEINIYSVDNNNNPIYYLLKKKVKSFSGEIKNISFTFNEPEKFKTIYINDSNIIKIIKAKDTNNNEWLEVPSLAHDTVFTKERIDKKYSIKLKKVSNRFASKFKTDTKLEIQFGAGILNDIADEEIIPNFKNIGLGLKQGINNMFTAYDPSNFMFTKTYGLSPSNTTIKFEYLVGGGLKSNVPSNDITKFLSGNVYFDKNNLDPQISNTIINSISFNNELSSIGGSVGDSNNDLKNNIMASHSSQMRAVSKDDYIIRCSSLPPEYGVIEKVFIIDDNNFINIYILSKDNKNNLSYSDNILKNNLNIYLEEFKIIKDKIKILDPFIINIGINFDIIVKNNKNIQLVIKDCINKLYDDFNRKQNINEPILLSNIYSLLDNIDGVQNVKNIEIINKSGESSGYSKFSYDLNSAKINGIIYPSLDPSIFEIKYIDDIQGRNSQY